MQILVLLGMYFDAVVVFVTTQSLLFRLALAILCKLELYLDISSLLYLKINNRQPRTNIKFAGTYIF
jgi:hypothetical protein